MKLTETRSPSRIRSNSLDATAVGDDDNSATGERYVTNCIKSDN